MRFKNKKKNIKTKNKNTATKNNTKEKTNKQTNQKNKKKETKKTKQNKTQKHVQIYPNLTVKYSEKKLNRIFQLNEEIHYWFSFLITN